MEDNIINLYNELLLRNKELSEENSVLKAENLCLREQLKRLENLDTKEVKKLSLFNPQHAPINIIETHNIINKSSSSSDKINLFRSLFRGREDVFAKRWFSSKTGKSGYQPHCKHEWDSRLCDKKKFKCNVCPHRQFLPINDSVIELHLRGNDELCRDVLGIYPMFTDETCYFLAVDFDEGDFKNDALAFAYACQDNNIPVSIELSRSGNGAHAWIFFTEKVSAKLARQLGTALLTYAMNKGSNLKFRSYDRFFPNQDTMPTGGFGNLIALPLQGAVRRKGFSVFVDENFSPYPDQWAYLSSVVKLGLNEIEAFLCEQYKNQEFGSLLDEETEESTENLAQISILNKGTDKALLSPSDFLNDTVKIIKSNMLHIEKRHISKPAINKLSRLATFRNPAFYKAQAMRLPTYNKPRLISLAESSADYLLLPRGAEDELFNMLSSLNIKVEVEDIRNKGKAMNASFVGTLREEQALAVREMLKYDTGVLSATTAFGKTVVASNIIAEHKTNTLVLVHTLSLLEQWKKSLSTFLSIESHIAEETKTKKRKRQSIIGQLGGGKNTCNGVIDIALMQSLIKDGEVKEVVKDYGQVIVDECHHVSSVSFEKILKSVTAQYVYGLTATPIRQDGHQPIIFLQCGHIRYKVDAKSEAVKRPFEHFLVPRLTSECVN